MTGSFQRKWFTPDEIRSLLSLWESHWDGLVLTQILGTVIADSASRISNLLTVLEAMVSSAGNSRQMDVQLTVAVWLIRSRLDEQNVPDFRRDETAEKLIRAWDLQDAEFKLLLKSTLFDRGALRKPGLTVFYQ
jgi:hypothetical protein